MITSRDNQYIRLCRALGQKKSREATGLFLAEGRRLVGDLIDRGLKPQVLLYADDFADPRLDSWEAQAVQALAVEAKVLAAAGQTESGQGVVAAFNQLCPGEADFLAARPRLAFVLSGVADPGNLGAMIRNSAAAGVDALFLTDQGVELWNPKVVRSSMGALAQLMIFDRLDNQEIDDLLSRGGFSLYLAEADGDPVYWQLPQDRPCAVVMGSEAAGPGPFWRRRCGQRVYIPQSGAVESLNVAMAQGVIAFSYCHDLTRRSERAANRRDP